MKRVVIVRHAKSVPYGYDDDFNRDLTDRGINDAEKISLKLREKGVFPELVIASPATRTMHTAAVFCQNLGYDLAAIRQEMAIYNGLSTQSFINLLNELPENVQTVFVFGHNPTVHTLAYNLVNEFYSDMPTCATVVIEFPVEKWKRISARSGEVAFHLIPKSM